MTTNEQPDFANIPTEAELRNFVLLAAEEAMRQDMMRDFGIPLQRPRQVPFRTLADYFGDPKPKHDKVDWQREGF